MADGEPRNPSGSNDASITLADLRAVLEPETRYNASEIVEKLDAPKRTVNYRLNKLADDDKIVKEKLGHQTVLWTLPAESDQTEASDE